MSVIEAGTAATADVATSPSGSELIVPASKPHIPNLAAVLLVHAVALAYAPRTFSLGALAVLVIMVFLTACVGWSVGVHRCIIHRSFDCPRWLRYVLAYLSTLAGIGGPLYTYQSHNTRDYYQSLPDGPDISGYHRSFLYSYWSLLLRRPHPAGAQPVPAEVADDPFLRFLDRTNLLNQIPVAGLLYLLGGWDYVVWGGIVRIAVVFDLFASVNYFCHARGYRRFRIRGCTEEGRNNVVLGIIGMGEGWHNNHHAYPRSARMGIAWWELDLGYITIRLLHAAGLVWNVKTPRNTELRACVTRVDLRSTVADSR